jgi:hypothetical protein
VLLADDIDNPDGFVTKSDALTDEFSMLLTTRTRHRRVDGVDLSAKSGGDMFIVNEPGTTLSFDFDTLEIKGLAANPTIDMRLRIHEEPGSILACTDLPGCLDNAPDNVVSPSSIWAKEPWLLEYFAAYAGWLHYSESLATGSYECFGFFGEDCLAGALIGDPANKPAGYPATAIGWTEFILHDIFDPDELTTPPPQFFWELLVSIADTMFHDPNGDSSPDFGPEPASTFTFYELGLGITGEELVEGVDEDNDGIKEQKGVRDFLREQEALLSDIMVGEYWRNNAAVDFYFWRGDDGVAPYLFFANETDLRPDPSDANKMYAPVYQTPGFFSCPELSASCKVSTTTLGGVEDTTHEKLELAPGRTTVYVRDDQGDDYEVDIIMPESGAELVIELAAR